MTERIQINTDDLRELARNLNGALQQVGDIRMHLLRSSSTLVDSPYQQILTSLEQAMARLEAIGTVIADDQANLAQQVLAVEAEEGSAPVAPPPPPPPVAPPGMPPFRIVAFPFWWFVRKPAPDPWSGQWVNPDGTLPEQASAEARAGFGTSWQARGSFNTGVVSGSGSVKASGGGWAYGEADAGVDKDGTARAHAKAGAGIEASVHTEGRIDAGPVHAKGQADASVGAKAVGEASASAGPDGVQASVSGEVSAEAKAGAQGEVGVDGVGHAAGHAEAQAGGHAGGHAAASVGTDGVAASGGLGAEIGASAGAGGSIGGSAAGAKGGGEVKVGLGIEVHGGGALSWDKVGLNFDVGAALGIGAGFSLDLSISPKEILGAVGDAITDPVGTLEGAVDMVADAASSAADAAVDVADAVSDFFDPPGPRDSLLDGAAAAAAAADHSDPPGPSDPDVGAVATVDHSDPAGPVGDAARAAGLDAAAGAAQGAVDSVGQAAGGVLGGAQSAVDNARDTVQRALESVLGQPSADHSDTSAAATSPDQAASDSLTAAARFLAGNPVGGPPWN